MRVTAARRAPGRWLASELRAPRCCAALQWRWVLIRQLGCCCRNKGALMHNHTLAPPIFCKPLLNNVLRCAHEQPQKGPDG